MFRTYFELASAFKVVFDEGSYFVRAQVLEIALIFLYMVLLPSLVTGQVTVQALQFLTPIEFVFAVLMGSLLSVVIITNLFAMRRVRTCHKKTVAFSILTSMLASSLCCMPIIPAAVGLLSAYTTVAFAISPAIQAFIVRYAVAFYAASSILLVYSLQLISKEVVKSAAPRTKQPSRGYVSLRC